MFVHIFASKLGKSGEHLGFVLRQFCGHLNIDVHMKIAAATAAKRRHPDALESEHLAGLRARGYFDRVVVVACSANTQRLRLRVDRGLSDDLAARIIAAQLDLREKISRATHLIWNDSTPASLERQATLLANWLRHRYG